MTKKNLSDLLKEEANGPETTADTSPQKGPAKATPAKSTTAKKTTARSSFIASKIDRRVESSRCHEQGKDD
jgi:topoisomerase IA-like protein